MIDKILIKKPAQLFLCILLSSFCYFNTTKSNIYLGDRPSSEPYLSGDTFRKYCDHVFDIKDQANPETIKRGDIVFVCSDPHFLNEFFQKYHPLIKEPYILVTHNSDENITEKYKVYLESDKIYLWFAQNVAYIHPKLIPIPIGLENNVWQRHYVEMINSLIIGGINQEEKRYLAYMNFSTGTNNAERLPAYNYFNKTPFCYCSPRKGNVEYLRDVCHSIFIVSPHGNGLDCHRTWEALYLGAIPIVKRSTLDKMYEDLPVLIVDDWSEATQEFLEKKYIELSRRSYKLEKLYIQFWIDTFEFYKKLCKNSVNGKFL